MRKDDATREGDTWVKHSRNGCHGLGRRGHNKRVRKAAKAKIRSNAEDAQHNSTSFHT